MSIIGQKKLPERKIDENKSKIDWSLVFNDNRVVVVLFSIYGWWLNVALCAHSVDLRQYS